MRLKTISTDRRLATLCAISAFPCGATKQLLCQSAEQTRTIPTAGRSGESPCHRNHHAPARACSAHPPIKSSQRQTDSVNSREAAVDATPTHTRTHHTTPTHQSPHTPVLQPPPSCPARLTRQSLAGGSIGGSESGRLSQTAGSRHRRRQTSARQAAKRTHRVATVGSKTLLRRVMRVRRGGRGRFGSGHQPEKSTTRRG